MPERCVHCGDCVELCPQSGDGVTDPVFTLPGEGSDVRVSHIENCIACHTCVEFCRAAAITVSGDEGPVDGMQRMYGSRPANRII